MSNSSRIILESLTEITLAVSSNLGIEISFMRPHLAFPMKNLLNNLRYPFGPQQDQVQYFLNFI